MPETLHPDLAREIASAPRAPFGERFGAERVSRHVARSDGYLDAAGGAWGRGAYALFEEMEEKDAHLYGILQTRRNGVLARPRGIEPATMAPRDVEFAEWAGRALEAIPGWERALAGLLDALGKGMAVVEIVWGYDAEGRVVPLRLAPRSPWRFVLGVADEIRLNDDPFSIAGRSDRPGQATDVPRPRSLATAPRSVFAEGAPGSPLPARKFMTMFFGRTDERPYGRGLCERVYWYWWFKKNNTRFWVLYNEKFGAPTVVARHAPGLSQTERDRLLEVISSIQSDAGVTVPEGIALELLEPTRGGSSQTYRELSDWCNDEMSRAVLGQTLTTSEGRRSGSLALGRVHEAVRFDYVRADASLLMEAVNSQIVRWMADFNLGPEAPAPRWTIDLVPDLDVQLEADVDRRLLQMGVPLPLRHFYEKYRRPAPSPDERALRYDDSNLYQYHLQFGVLTVNEVRALLGLPAVEWGDRAPVPAGTERASGGAGSGRAAGPGDDRGDEESRDADADEGRRRREE